MKESQKLSDEYYNFTEPRIIPVRYSLTLKVVNKKTGCGIANVPVHAVKGSQDVFLLKTNHRGNLYTILHKGHYTSETGDILQNNKPFTIEVNAPNTTGYKPQYSTYTTLISELTQETNLVTGLTEKGRTEQSDGV